MIIDNNEEAFTVDEVLTKLNINRATFYRYCQKGLLAKFWHGGKTYVRQSWIDEYWKRRSEEGVNERARVTKTNRTRRKRT